MSALPPLAGAAEAAALLGVEVQRIARWRREGRMPALAADLAMGPVWTVAQIEAMRDEREAVEPPALKVVGTREAAALVGVDKSQISRWLREGQRRGTELFPPPAQRLAAGPLWPQAAVAAFAERRSAA